MDLVYIIGAVVTALVTFVLCQSFIIVHEGEMIIMERLGQFSSILKPGLHLMVPFLDRPRSVDWTRRVEVHSPNGTTHVRFDKFNSFRIRTSNVAFDIPPVKCYTKEKIMVDVNIIVYYNITDLKKAIYQVSDLYAGIESKVETLLVNMVLGMSLDEITNKGLQLEMIKHLQDEKWQEEWGVQVNRFDIQQVILPNELAEATLGNVTLKRKMESEQFSIETEKQREMAKLKSNEMLAEMRRTSELNQKSFDIKKLQLQQEYENAKLIKSAETDVLNEKSRQDLQTEIARMKYAAIKNSGLSENYFIERKRSKSVSKILEAGFLGQGKMLIVPYEALISGNNSSLLLNRALSSDSSSSSQTQETIVLNK